MTLEKFLSLSHEEKIAFASVITRDTLRGWLTVANDEHRSVIADILRERNRRRASSQEMPSEALENARAAMMSATIAFKRASALLQKGETK